MPSLDADTLSALTDVLGGAAKSGASANQIRDALRISLENAKQNRDRFATTAPGVRLSTGIRASAAAHAKPAQVHWGGPGSGLRGEIPTITGGTKSVYDAVGDPETKALIDMVMRDTTAQQRAGGPTGGGKDTALPRIGETSLLDKVLGGASLASGIGSALGKNSAGGSLNLNDLYNSIFKNRRGMTEDPNNFFEGPQNPNDFQGPTDYADPDLWQGPQQPPEEQKTHTDYGSDDGWAW